MTPLTWLAIGIGVPVAYAAMAGLTWRVFVQRRAGCSREFSYGYTRRECRGTSAPYERRCLACDMAILAGPLWPVALPVLALLAAVRVIVAPLRATFRLTSGQTMNKHGEK